MFSGLNISLDYPDGIAFTPGSSRQNKVCKNIEDNVRKQFEKICSWLQKYQKQHFSNDDGGDV